MLGWFSAATARASRSMVQRGDGPGFPLEARPTVRIRRHRLGQYLQRNVAM
jgi:hypothetical protein